VAADYFAYSVSDDCGLSTNILKENLAVLRERAGERKYYLGELGFVDREVPFLVKPTISQIQVALKEGAEFVVIWNIYDNEVKEDGQDRGLGLIRRDGSVTVLYNQLVLAIANNQFGELGVFQDYFVALGQVMAWLVKGQNEVIGAVVKLKKDYQPPADWILHTSRNNTTGDQQAWAGEVVSIYLPTDVSAFVI
jgi:hypothetical protein